MSTLSPQDTCSIATEATKQDLISIDGVLVYDANVSFDCWSMIGFSISSSASARLSYANRLFLINETRKVLFITKITGSRSEAIVLEAVPIPQVALSRLYPTAVVRVQRTHHKEWMVFQQSTEKCSSGSSVEDFSNDTVRRR